MRPKPECAIVFVTPELATKWLDLNENNRRVRTPHVDHFVGILERGEWMLLNDAIAFDWDNFMGNGQHRMMGMERAKIGGECLVLTGIDPETTKAMDRVRVRNLSDDFYIDGESNSSPLAAAVTGLWKWENGVFGTSSYKKPTTKQAEAVLAAHPAIRDGIAEARRLSNVGGIPSEWAPLLHIFRMIDKELADWFAESFEKGYNLSERDAVLHLRNFLIKTKAQKGFKMTQAHRTAIMIKAWNFTYQDLPCTPRTLAIRFNGKYPEKFPEIIGAEDLR